MLFLPRGLAGLLRAWRPACAIASRGAVAPPARGGDRRREQPLLEVRGLTQALRGRPRAARLLVRRPGRGDQGHHRAQRGREDHAVQPDHRRVPADRGEVRFRGQRLTGLPRPPGGAPRRLPDVPERAALPEPLRRRERDGGRRRVSGATPSWTPLLGLPGPAESRSRSPGSGARLSGPGRHRGRRVRTRGEPAVRPAEARRGRARAWPASPQLLLLDEPAAGLNSTEKVEMMRLIGRLRELGMAVLLIEHDMRLVMGVSDRVVVLNYGEKIAEGTPAEVQADRAVVAGVSRRGGRRALLEVTDLVTRYGAVEALRGVSLAVRAGRAGLRCSAPTAPASPRCSSRSSACCRRRGAASSSKGSISPAAPPTTSCARASRSCPSAGACSARSPCATTSCSAPTRCPARTPGSRKSTSSSPCCGPGQPAGGHPVGRRAADAGDRPRAHEPPAAAAVRRAVARPGPAGDAGDHAAAGRAPRARHHRAAGGAERRRGPAYRATAATCSRRARSRWKGPRRTCSTTTSCGPPTSEADA